MSRPRLLDLFCGAGGASWGYHLAGFEVWGVDIRPQPRYPFSERFIMADALDYLRSADLSGFDLIAASPPCQAYSICRHTTGGEYPDLVEPTRAALKRLGTPYVIENVVGAPLLDPLLLCGVQFGLRVFRHRLFECSEFLLHLPHSPHGERRIGFDGFCCVAGHGDGGRLTRIDRLHRRKETWETAMGIDWMRKYELTQAVPPAYTRWIGQQLLAVLEERDG